jgi:uridine monophosphate synthetase
MPEMGFFARLEARCREADSLLCIGLDPRVGWQTVPGRLTTAEKSTLQEAALEAALEAREFCMRLVEATADQAAAFKPNSAYFEALGAAGIEVLQQVIAAIPPEIPVILDAKRGDIASTAQAYARAVFEIMGAAAVTASPYLGYDSLEPFFAYPERGVFLLCKTSNPGSSDLQDLRLFEYSEHQADTRVFEAVARLAVEWSRQPKGGYLPGNYLPESNLGLVVGATHPEALRRVRAIAPQLWILAPGVGAQGGDLQAALWSGLRADGLGLLLPVSRQVAGADDPRQAALQLRQAINRQRQRFIEESEQERLEIEEKDRPIFVMPGISVEKPAGNLSGANLAETGLPGVLEALLLRKKLAAGLLAAGCIRFGSFKLKSGMESPIYIDLRLLAGYPALLKDVASAYLPVLTRLVFDRIAALPYAALPIATAISLQASWSMIYPRKEVKAYGTRAEIEGVYQPGERVVVVDDLITTGESKFEAVERLRAAGLLVQDIVVLIDRQSGADRVLQQAGLTLHTVFTLGELLDIWETDGSVAPEDITAARALIQPSTLL